MKDIVIPQPLQVVVDDLGWFCGDDDRANGNNVKLRVTFTLQNDQMAEPITQVSTKDLITDTVTEWKEGCRYLYTISVDLDEIYFEPSVTDWVDVDVNDFGDAEGNI